MSDAFLSQDEVDALLQGVTGEADAPKAEVPEIDPSSVREYNLATQERIVRGRMPTLEIINERFIRLLRIELLNSVHRNLEVTIDPVRTLKYSEFIRNLVMPTNLNLIHVNPLRGTGLIVFEPTLVFSIIDNMFGGDGRFHTRVEGRDFTQTEQRIIQRILEIVFENYEKSWESIYKIEMEYIRSEISMQFASIATPNEVVVLTTVSIQLAGTVGHMYICLPYSMVEPIRDILTSSMQGEVLGVDKRWIKQMTEQIKAAEVEVVANLAKIDMQISDVVNMKIGDVIPISISQDIDTTVDGVPVMRCQYGVFNGQYALKVKQLLRADAAEYVKGEHYE